MFSGLENSFRFPAKFFRKSYTLLSHLSWGIPKCFLPAKFMRSLAFAGKKKRWLFSKYKGKKANNRHMNFAGNLVDFSSAENFWPISLMSCIHTPRGYKNFFGCQCLLIQVIPCSTQVNLYIQAQSSKHMMAKMPCVLEGSAGHFKFTQVMTGVFRIFSTPIQLGATLPCRRLCQSC